MKLFKKVMIFLVAFSSLCYVESTCNVKTAHAAEIPDKVLIMNKRTGLQININDNKKVISISDPMSDASQWIFTQISDHYNITNVDSKLQLHMNANNKVVAFNDSENTSNQWDLNEVEEGYYTITNVRTGLQLHMNGSNSIVVWNDATNPSNLWKLEDDFDSVPVIENPSQQPQIIDFAKTFLGTPYVWGGTTPKGFDCSGFTQHVFNNMGMSIGRTTYNQINAGIAVSRDSLKAGDLIFTSKGHVGIYVGNNKMIHAPYTGARVRVENIWSFYAARRIIN